MEIKSKTQRIRNLLKNQLFVLDCVDSEIAQNVVAHLDTMTIYVISQDDTDQELLDNVWKHEEESLIRDVTFQRRMRHISKAVKYNSDYMEGKEAREFIKNLFRTPADELENIFKESEYADIVITIHEMRNRIRMEE